MVLLFIYIVSHSICFYAVNDCSGCSTSCWQDQCCYGLDLSEPETNNNRRVIGRRKKTRSIARFPCDNTVKQSLSMLRKRRYTNL